MIEFISSLIIPAVILCAGILMTSRKRDFFAAFATGAKEGLEITVGLLPAMVLLSVGLSMFSSSGAVELLTGWLSGAGSKIGVPAELLPLLFTRPVSGSASTATYAKLLETYGADSFVSLCASVIMGSSDTLVYVVAVYFSGAKGVKKTRHAFPVAAAIMVLCIFLSCALSRLFFPARQ